LGEGYDRAYWESCCFYGGLNAVKFSGSGTFNAWWERCWFFSITKAFDFPDGANDFLNMGWSRCVWRYCEYDIYAQGGDSFYLENNLHEACTGAEALHLTGVYHIHVNSDHFEQNKRDILVDVFNGKTPKILTLDKLTHTKTATCVNNLVLVNAATHSTVRGVVTLNSGGPTDADYKWDTTGGQTVEIDQACIFANAPSVSTGFDFSRSAGTWTPAITGLTVVGAAPTVTGAYVKNGPMVHFFVHIVPAGADTTASVAGTTYSTLPFVPMQSPFPWFGAQVVDSSLNTGTGGVSGSAWVRGSGVNVCHFPTWTASNGRITISGSYMVSFN
jgi:hypothetical protein